MNDSRFDLEKLESRLLLAVSVLNRRGILSVVGSLYGDETIVLRGTGTPGQVEVYADQDGDRVVDTDPITIASGVTKIRVLTSFGDDVVVVDGVQIADDLSILLSSGNNCVGILNGTEIGDDLTLGGLFGTNLFSLDGVNVDGDLAVATLAGNDFIRLNDVVVLGTAKVLTGFGNDLVQIENTAISGVTQVKLSFGNDLLVLDENTISFGTGSRLDGGVENDRLAVTNAATFDPASIGAVTHGFEQTINRSTLSPTVYAPFADQFQDCLARVAPLFP